VPRTLSRPPRSRTCSAATRDVEGADTAVYADAAYAILTSPSREARATRSYARDVLVEHGITDLSGYSVSGSDADLRGRLFRRRRQPPGYDA